MNVMGRSRREVVASSLALLVGSTGCTSDIPASEPEPNGYEPLQRMNVTVAYDGEPVTLLDNGTVRYVSGYRNTDESTDEPVYETVPFGEWAAIQAGERAAIAVQQHVVEELDLEDSDTIEPGLELEPPYRIDIGLVKLMSRSGAVVSTPPVTVTDVSRVAPSAVDVRFTYEEKVYDRTYPVNVANVTSQQL